MGKIAWKGGALLAPVPPAMVTCGSGESANIITVAWTGLINTQPPRVSISVRPSRHSYALIRESGEFVINLTPASLIRAADFCGMYTGAKVNKFQAAGLTPAPAQAVACPIIAECPLALECRVISVLPQGTHDLFLADVVAVDVDESILDADGKLRMDKANLAAFAHGEYFSLGKKIGTFGFSAAKKKKRPPSPAPKNPQASSEAKMLSAKGQPPRKETPAEGGSSPARRPGKRPGGRKNPR